MKCISSSAIEYYQNTIPESGHKMDLYSCYVTVFNFVVAPTKCLDNYFPLLNILFISF